MPEDDVLASGQAAVLYYLSGYLFTTLAAFTVIAIVMRHLDTEDISGLAGLNRRSPLLAATLTLAMVSLAGIPPLAGFMGKLLIFVAAFQAHLYGLLVVAIGGVVVSIYFFFGWIKAAYFAAWSPNPGAPPAVRPLPAAPSRVAASSSGLNSGIAVRSSIPASMPSLDSSNSAAL